MHGKNVDGLGKEVSREPLLALRDERQCFLEIERARAVVTMSDMIDRAQ